MDWKLLALLLFSFLLVGADLNQNAQRVQTRKIQIYSTTYNVNAMNPPHKIDWLYNKTDNNPPDLLIIGLQEIVQLNFPKVITGLLMELKWVKTLERSLTDKYQIIGHHRLVGIFVAVFKRVDSNFHVKQMHKASVATGLAKVYGNKGAVGISLILDSMRLAILSSHLTAGQTQAAKRKHDFQKIAQDMHFNGPVRTLFDHDVVIWLGDLNSRLNTNNYDDVIRKINQNALIGLLEIDQLRVSQQEKTAFAGFRELPITFKPTYKYDIGTNTFDTSKKHRTPAWCDRILFWQKLPQINIQQLTYTSQQDIVFSDHRPVQSMFNLSLDSAEFSASEVDKSIQEWKEQSEEGQHDWRVF
ncbi:Hrpf-1 [Aphelenchoides bicaudatus]|nr:Hrpf-1 [Aphelenchoides bicaudatus]